MKTTHRRVAAVTLSTLVLGSAGALTTMEAAQAVTVGHDRATGNTEIYLDAGETYNVRRTGHGSEVCGNAINAAASQGFSITDEQRHSCEMAVLNCVGQASARGNALSGVRFYPTRPGYVATYVCLVR